MVKQTKDGHKLNQDMQNIAVILFDYVIPTEPQEGYSIELNAYVNTHQVCKLRGQFKFCLKRQEKKNKICL